MAAHAYGAKASIEDLREIKNSLEKLLNHRGECCEYPLHKAADSGDLKLMEFLLTTSYDMNTAPEHYLDFTPFMEACESGKTDMARLLIQSSQKHGIDLNARDAVQQTAFHMTCVKGNTELARLMIESSKEYTIDLNARCEEGSKHFIMLVKEAEQSWLN